MKEEENGDIVADGGSVPRSSIRINVAPDLNNHLQSLDLFRSMIIKKNRSKVRDGHWKLIG